MLKEVNMNSSMNHQGNNNEGKITIHSYVFICLSILIVVTLLLESSDYQNRLETNETGAQTSNDSYSCEKKTVAEDSVDSEIPFTSTNANNTIINTAASHCRPILKRSSAYMDNIHIETSIQPPTKKKCSIRFNITTTDTTTPTTAPATTTPIITSTTNRNMNILPKQQPVLNNNIASTANILPQRQSPPSGLKSTILRTNDVTEDRRQRALGMVYITHI